MNINGKCEIQKKPNTRYNYFEVGDGEGTRGGEGRLSRRTCKAEGYVVRGCCILK